MRYQIVSYRIADSSDVNLVASHDGLLNQQQQAEWHAKATADFKKEGYATGIVTQEHPWFVLQEQDHKGNEGSVIAPSPSPEPKKVQPYEGKLQGDSVIQMEMKAAEKRRVDRNNEAIRAAKIQERVEAEMAAEEAKLVQP